MKKETASSENDYEVAIKKQGNEFVFVIPELNLIVRDNDIRSGYEEICSEKERLIKKYKDAQFDISELPKKKENPILGVTAQKMTYGQLAIKTVIASAVFCLFFIASIYIASSIVAFTVETLLLRQLPDAAPRELAEQVNILAKKIQDTSPEDKKKFQESLMIIMNELKPAFEVINSVNVDKDGMKKR